MNHYYVIKYLHITYGRFRKCSHTRIVGDKTYLGIGWNRYYSWGRFMDLIS